MVMRIGHNNSVLTRRAERARDDLLRELGYEMVE
jgi:hypothetical protein